jgi:hypothetical protein
MRLIGVLLLIAVLVVGFGVFKAAPSSEAPVVLPAPDPQVAELEAQLAVLRAELREELEEREPLPLEYRGEPGEGERRAEEPGPALLAQEAEPRRAHGCVATPGNGHGSSPTLTVADGHLLSVQWYADGGRQEQSVLPAGRWTPNAGVRVGAHWEYPDCPEETVVNQAVAANGSVTDPSNGFTSS